MLIKTPIKLFKQANWNQNDYTQAFDSVYRDKIFIRLNNYGVPSKLIKLIAKTLQNTKARVKVNQSHTEYFVVSTGIKKETHCQ
jgi:N-acetyl-gamma-glutamylphosphate reductase